MACFYLPKVEVAFEMVSKDVVLCASFKNHTPEWVGSKAQFLETLLTYSIIFTFIPIKTLFCYCTWNIPLRRQIYHY